MTTVKRKPRGAHGLRGGSSEANRLAVAILEVLAGVRAPAEAAQALEISLPRYYQLETRALEGLVAACERKGLGKQPSLQVRIDSLEKELQQARRECARQQALVRVTQRSLGLKAAASSNAKGPKQRSGRKKRRPAVRALKAAQALRENVRPAEGEAVQQEASQRGPSEAARRNKHQDGHGG